MPNIKYKPTWAQYEEAANNPNDANLALKASDAFEEEREKEMKTSRQARDWENDRKKEIYSQKPAWAKKQREEEQEKLKKPFYEFKEGGSFNANLKPAPGYILVKIDAKEATDSGIYLPENESEPNSGTIVEISDGLIIDGKPVSCPVKTGQRILFKKYAGAMGTGLELRLKGDDYRLMRWHVEPTQSDILGVLE